MVKTTINLDTQVYRALIKEALEKYGTTKTLSRIINEKLRSRLGKDKDIDIVRETAGMWKTEETGIEYKRRARSETEKRFRRIYGRSGI
jgi:hypothetical protein